MEYTEFIIQTNVQCDKIGWFVTNWYDHARCTTEPEARQMMKEPMYVERYSRATLQTTRYPIPAANLRLVMRVTQDTILP